LLRGVLSFVSCDFACSTNIAKSGPPQVKSSGPLFHDVRQIHLPGKAAPEGRLSDEILINF
jgi:hypothetical protein